MNLYSKMKKLLLLRQTRFFLGLNVQVDVAVNAPESGKITKLFYNEEDTVAVGAELFSIELGSAPESNCVTNYF